MSYSCERDLTFSVTSSIVNSHPYVPNGDPAPVAWNKKNAAMMSTSTMVSILPIHEYYYSIPVKLGGRERGGPGGPLPWRYRGDTIDR